MVIHKDSREASLESFVFASAQSYERFGGIIIP